MKIYSNEESENVHMLGRGRHTLVHANLLKLKPGEKLFIESKVDWLSKTPPYRLVKRFAEKQKWTLQAGRSTDGKGWIVHRIK